MPLVFGEQREHLSQMFYVFFKSLAVYQYVVKENNGTATEKGFQCGVHGSLEGAWGARKTKSNNSEFIVANMGGKCSLMFLSFPQPNLMIP